MGKGVSALDPMVTTERFTAPAVKYAAAKGIRLALLRPPDGKEDWGNLLRTVHFIPQYTVPVGDPTVNWKADRTEFERAQAAGLTAMHMEPAVISISNESGQWETFQEVWDEASKGVPVDSKGVMKGTITYDEPRQLRLGDFDLAIDGFDWEIKMTTVQGPPWSVGYGIGDLTAELMFRTLDGSIQRVFSNKQIAAFTIENNGRVVPKVP
jgi:hypothetical protein